jgi:hypothetical protein
MCNHEKETVKETDVIERRQRSPSPDYEKGSRDQNFQISQVGHTGNDRKRDASANTPEEYRVSSARSFWFDDKTKEIGHAACASQFEFGWVYRRTQTGHIRERTGHRDSVS